MLNKKYFEILHFILNLIDELNTEVSIYFEKINNEIILKTTKDFGKTYNTINYYKGSNNVNKFVLSQINDYYKKIYIFGNISYYTYNKSKNLYSNINLLRYKYFEYRNGINQKNKPVLHYIFFFQFIDFLLTKGKLILEPYKIIEIGYTLFGGFLEKLLKIEFLTKFRPIYYYSSILNIELTNNVGISKNFVNYPYSVRFLVYKLNKILKEKTELNKEEIVKIIKKEIENKDNKIGARFKQGGKEHNLLVSNILNVITDNYLISEDDKKTLGTIKNKGYAEQELMNIITENTINNNLYDELIKNIQILISNTLILFNKEELNLKNQKIGFILYRLFQDINLNKMLIINKKFGNYENDTFLGIINIIKSKQLYGIKKIKPIKVNIVEINNSILKI